MVNVYPLKNPYQDDSPPKWIDLSMNNVRELHPQYDIYHNETKAGANGSWMRLPDFGLGVKLHHCPCVNIEKVEEDLSHEVMRSVNSLEMGKVSATVDVHQPR